MTDNKIKKDDIKKYLDLTEQVAKDSKDPSTHVGAVIVDKLGNEISRGCNNFVAGGDEKFMTWNLRPMKYSLVVHAEMSAIISAKQDLTDCSIYTLYAPCSNCLKHILQAGITKIFYKNLLVNSQAIMKSDEKEAIARLILSKPGVICKNYNGNDWINELDIVDDTDISNFVKKCVLQKQK